MNFTRPFSRIYAEVMAKTYESYLREQQKDQYRPLYNSPPDRKDGIEGILDHETVSLATKLQVDASFIGDRLKLNKEHYDIMMYNWFDVRNKILQLEDNSGGYLHRDSTRLTSSLQNQLTSISSEIINQKLQCWQHLVDPMKSFLDTWDKYEQHKLEKRLVGDLQ